MVENDIKVLKLFILLAKSHFIHELPLNDIYKNFSKLKNMDEYKEMLNKYNFIDGVCFEITDELNELIANNIVKYSEHSGTISITDNFKLIDKHLKNVNDKTKKLIHKMIDDYITLNMKKTKQNIKIFKK